MSAGEKMSGSEVEWGTERVAKVRALVATMNGRLARAFLREDEAEMMQVATYYSSQILAVSVVEFVDARAVKP